ncbi:MAG: riboflavin synthase [Candidatus Pseudobacter hemicellulosilyticus]|uniref:Riboflavin synthase n=1 Tax=Candidatus Pseudobacter hemicellulosilyticus TaxID=3121375 RepID=A0AAJ5WRB7_9BACT|nr:MAG: riboflavin synthase [Pseudobacter sp.]
MFTGIIETMGRIEEVLEAGTNRSFWISSSLTPELKPDQSVAHDGVCLTVESIENDLYKVTAINETLQKTNLRQWQPGHDVNLERCLVMNGRLDGHIVQGHTDTVANCIDVSNLPGSHVYRFSIREEFAPLIIEKGSIALNGISLTLFDVTVTEFSVAIIPYTFQHTNIAQVQPGAFVNVEFDLIGKYLARTAALSINKS